MKKCILFVALASMVVLADCQLASAGRRGGRRGCGGGCGGGSCGYVGGCGGGSCGGYIGCSTCGGQSGHVMGGRRVAVSGYACANGMCSLAGGTVVVQGNES